MKKNYYTIKVYGSISLDVLNKYVKIVQENSQLKEVIETLKNTNALLIKQKYQLEQDVDRFYSRIENAIDYIQDNKLNTNKISEMLCRSEIIKLLEILKGE